VTTQARGPSMLLSVGTALVLAILAALPVAWSFLLRPDADLSNAGFAAEPVDWRPVDPLSALILAVTVLVSCAIVGGVAGAFAWRWRRTVGACVALVTAWATGILLLPLAAAVLGIHLRTGILCFLTPCDALLRDDRPLDGAYGYVNFVAGNVFFVGSGVLGYLIGLAVVYVLAAGVRRRFETRPVLPVIVWLLGFAIAHGMALLISAQTSGALIPYVVLTIGVVAWTVWMDRAERSANRLLLPGRPPRIPELDPAGRLQHGPGVHPCSDREQHPDGDHGQHDGDGDLDRVDRVE